MHVLIPAALFAVAVAFCSPAQAAQEVSCTGPASITGKAIGPTTLAVSGFECAGAPQPYNALGDRAANQSSADRLAQAARRAPFVVLDFKGPPPAFKTGDAVTVKGTFSVVLDADHQMNYVVVSGAQVGD
jgi:hypothetical protein